MKKLQRANQRQIKEQNIFVLIWIWALEHFQYILKLKEYFDLIIFIKYIVVNKKAYIFSLLEFHQYLKLNSVIKVVRKVPHHPHPLHRP